MECKSLDNEITKIRFNDVLFVPQLENNLIFVNKITSFVNTVIFTNNTCGIKHNNKVIALENSFSQFQSDETNDFVTVYKQSYNSEEKLGTELLNNKGQEIFIMERKDIQKEDNELKQIRISTRSTK